MQHVLHQMFSKILNVQEVSLTKPKLNANFSYTSVGTSVVIGQLNVQYFTVWPTIFNSVFGLKSSLSI